MSRDCEANRRWSQDQIVELFHRATVHSAQKKSGAGLCESAPSGQSFFWFGTFTATTRCHWWTAGDPATVTVLSRCIDTISIPLSTYLDRSAFASSTAR